MSKKLYEEQNIQGIADAIREKNGTQNRYTVAQMPAAVRDIKVESGEAVVQPLTVTQNGTYNPPSGVDGYSPVTVNVSGGGIYVKGFELYTADTWGDARTNRGSLNNNYFCCFFDDNKSPNYTLNGNSASFSVQTYGMSGSTGLQATTVAVTNASQPTVNAIISGGSIFSTSHNDTGSLISVVGGWVGYPSGGDIYEQAANGTINSITMSKAYDKLLVFIGASISGTAVTSVDINGSTYEITNNGMRYNNVYGSYAAIEINGLNASVITVTFPTNCYNYVSVIGIDT